MAAVLPANDLPGPSLKQRLARAERFNRLKSKALILPLLLFLLLTFLLPIGLAVFVVAIVGWVYEYYRGYFAR